VTGLVAKEIHCVRATGTRSRVREPLFTATREEPSTETFALDDQPPNVYPPQRTVTFNAWESPYSTAATDPFAYEVPSIPTSPQPDGSTETLRCSVGRS
jgi:hypothetical protein